MFPDSRSERLTDGRIRISHLPVPLVQEITGAVQHLDKPPSVTRFLSCYCRHLPIQRVKKHSLLFVNPRKALSFLLTTSSKKNGVKTELTPVNRSDQDLPQTFSVATLTLVLLTIIIALEGLAGNAVVLWLLGFHLHRNAFSIYILNLGEADFIFLCCHIIGSLEKLITSCHSSSSPIPSFFTTVLTFAYLTGLSFLSAISTEHCLSDLCPIWYCCHRPKHLSAIMWPCFGPWPCC
eukprot:bmy_03637T0